jgi:hypothetical protein
MNRIAAPELILYKRGAFYHQVCRYQKVAKNILTAICSKVKLLEHHCISLSTIVANRISKQFSKDSEQAVEKLIQQSLSIIAAK